MRTLSGVLHIPALAKNMISVSKMDDAGVKIVFKKYTCKMVWEALVLMQGVQIGTLYKLQGSSVVDGCNSSVVLESGAENLVAFGEKTRLWHQRLGHIREKGLQILHGKGMVEERMNKTFMERERSILGGARLVEEFWAATVETACYLVNRSPSSALEDKTPQGSRDVVFREVKNAIKHEVPSKEPKKIEFELKEEESDSTTEEELEDEEPQTLVEVVDLEDGKLWKEAMVDEMTCLQKNEACDLVELQARRKPIGSKWVLKKKTNAEGKVEKYKALLIAKGYS
eukprot:PITA_05734